MFVKGILRVILASISGLIYGLVAKIYDLFISLTKVTVISAEDKYIAGIYSRVTMILTIVMTFYVTFEFIKYIVTPESVNDKERGTGKLLYRIIMVIILIAFVPRIFSLAFKIQNTVLESQVLTKVIFGKVDIDDENYGKDLASNLFSGFYYYDEDFWSQYGGTPLCDGIPCNVLVYDNISKFRENGKFPAIDIGLDSENGRNVANNDVGGNKTFQWYINFNGLFAIAIGILTGYILLMYCIDIGIRSIQLAFLQLIAPIPIIGYLSPKKDNMCAKWAKQCLTTYLDLFIRIGIIYFAMLLCQIVTDAYADHKLITGVNPDMERLTYIILIMGLLLFAKRVPKMLQELFPKMGAASGNFGLKAGDRVAPLVARTAGAALGSTRAIGGAVARGINTARRNKEMGKTRKSRKADKEQLKADKKDMKQAQKDYNAAWKEYKKGDKTKGELDDARQKLNEKRNAVAKTKNESYRSVGWNATAGFFQGGWQGAKGGAQAKELKDIKGKVREGYKANRDALKAREDYLNAGGAGGFSGWADIQRTRFAQNIGLTTPSDQLEASMKSYDSQIERLQKQAQTEGAVLTSSKSAEDTNKSKITGPVNKCKAQLTATDSAAYNGLKERLLKKTGAKVDISKYAKDTNMAAISAEYSKIATEKKNTAQAAATIAENAKNDAIKAGINIQAYENIANLDKQINDLAMKPDITEDEKAKIEELKQQKTTEEAKLSSLSAEQQSSLANYENAKNNSTSASNAAKEAEDNSTIVNDELAKFENSQILLAGDKAFQNEHFDQVAVRSVLNARDGILEASKDLETYTKFEKALEAKYPRDKTNQDKYMELFKEPGKIEDYEDLDTIAKILNGISGEHQSKVSSIQHKRAMVANGDYHAEVKATQAAASSSNSGKK